MEILNQGFDFEIFRDLLIERLRGLPKGKGGRPPYDYILIFKMLILQRYYNLPDDQAEYQMNGRMSSMRFWDLSMADDTPGSKTVWYFWEQITDFGLTEEHFNLFLKELENIHLIINEGKTIDASFVEVPVQRNKREENNQVKQGEVPEKFKENPHKLPQKDMGVRWTKKDNSSYFGYKNHVKEDAKSKLITDDTVTDASVHDSNATEVLLNESGRGEAFYAGSAYMGGPQEKIIAGKGYRNKPLTDRQQGKTASAFAGRAYFRFYGKPDERNVYSVYRH